MKKKILALLLCISVLLPCFAILAFADDASVEYDDYENTYNEFLSEKESSTGERYCVGFERFIDVEKYISNAGEANYNTVTLVGLWEEYRNDDLIFMHMFLYNPMKQSFVYGEETYGYVDIATETSDGNYLIEFMRSDPFNDSDSMFMVVGFSIPSEMLNELNKDQRVYYMLTGHLITDHIGYDENTGINIYSYFDFSINTAYSFTGFNESKNVTRGIFDYLRYSNPIDDLVTITGQNRIEIKEAYPVDGTSQPSLVFLNEYGAGTEDFNLYLYVYNPKLLKYNYLHSYFYIDGKFRSFTFEHVSTESTLSKYRLASNQDKFNDDLSIREYYISALHFYKQGLLDDYISLEARYVYSDIPTESFTPTTFTYDLTDTVINAPAFAGNGNSCFTAGEQYLISFESKDIDTYDIEEWSDHFVINDSGDNWIEIEFIRTVTVLQFDKLVAQTLFPSAYYPDLSINITRIIPEDATDEEKDSIEAGTSSMPVDIDFGATRNDPIITADDEDYVEQNAVYLTAEVDGEIKIDGNYTYYRLDSSVNGLGKYQTLSTLYFSLPNKYLQSTGIPITDMYVSAIELAYSSAMLTPGIVTSDRDRYNELISYKSKDLSKLGYSIVTDASYYNNPSNSNSLFPYYSFNANMCIGPDLQKGLLSNSGIAFSEQYDTFDYLFLVEKFGTFDEVLSTDLLNSAVKNNIHTVTGFTPIQNILEFDKTYTLSSFHEMTFKEMWNSDTLSNWDAILYWLFGTEQVIMDTVENISCIETLNSAAIASALELDDASFSKKYFVALSDVSTMKDQMRYALENNNSFVLLRFDVFDYYSDYAGYVTNDVGTSELIDDSTFVFQTKYYKDLDVIRLETSNNYTQKLYKVIMDPMDTVGGGVTSPKPINPKPVNKVFGDGEFSRFEKILAIIGAILGVALVAFLLIYLLPMMILFIQSIGVGSRRRTSRGNSNNRTKRRK